MTLSEVEIEVEAKALKEEKKNLPKGNILEILTRDALLLANIEMKRKRKKKTVLSKGIIDDIILLHLQFRLINQKDDFDTNIYLDRN